MATTIVLRLAMLALTVVVLAPGPSDATAIDVVATGGGIRMFRMSPSPFSDVDVFLSGAGFSLRNNFLADNFVFTGSLAVNPAYSVLPVGGAADFSGFAQLGARDDTLGFDGVGYRASGQLNVSVPLVSVASTVSAPFTLTGDIRGLDVNGLVAVNLAIHGAGTMTADFLVLDRAGTQTELDRVQYGLAPVPEPSTWVLLASGVVAGLLLTMRRCRGSSPPA